MQLHASSPYLFYNASSDDTSGDGASGHEPSTSSSPTLSLIPQHQCATSGQPLVPLANIYVAALLAYLSGLGHA